MKKMKALMVGGELALLERFLSLAIRWR
ncbi:uncharacterized protein METZ01_LOCUS271127 [marine metagenome]|uniref:Uncharacterized protein n=1 Tax=marine metagenome TaxID=408172 RepID=A0A382K438_9ZZZZ